MECKIHIQNMLSLLFFGILTSSQLLAANPIVDLRTDEVSGFITENEQQYEITPNSGITCELLINGISRHGAPAGFKGWDVQLWLKKDNDVNKASIGNIMIFWDGKYFESPFSSTYKYSYNYFAPFGTHPTRVDGIFKKKERALEINYTNSGGLVASQVKMYLDSESTAVTKVIYIVHALGQQSTNLECTSEK